MRAVLTVLYLKLHPRTGRVMILGTPRACKECGAHGGVPGTSGTRAEDERETMLDTSILSSDKQTHN
jgi:hypothetical protein